MTDSPKESNVEKFFPGHASRQLMTDYNEANKGAVKSQIDSMNKAHGDQGETIELSASAYPWISPNPNENSMGTIWDGAIPDQQYDIMFQRFQLPPIIINKPIETAFSQDFKFVNPDGTPKDAEWVKKAMFYWKKDKSSFLRFCKYGLFKGYALFMFGFQDRKSMWATPVMRGTNVLWTQAVPKENVQELKVSDQIPKHIQYARVNFDTDQFTLDKNRFIHIMWPDLTDETSKEGISLLSSIYNLLQVQNHTDWAIGQSMWRGASGLLVLEAPKKGFSAEEKLLALGSTTNINARTVCYMPHGWKLKNIMTGGGNIAISRTYRTMLEQLAAGSNMPLSVMIGSQKGALSPKDEEDLENWYQWVNSLQTNFIQPALEKYFRKYQRGGQIPPGPFEIVWPAFETKSPLQKKKEEVMERALDRLKEILDDDEKWELFDPKELIEFVTKNSKR